MSDLALRLTLAVPSRRGLDEVLVGLVSLANAGAETVTVNGRFTLAEGDLRVTVSGPGGTLEAGWPWPADSGAAPVELAPGAVLETGVLLLCTATSAPLFTTAGEYTLGATYAAGAVGGEPVLRSEPVRVVRTEPASDEARADRRALTDRDVIQSLAAGGTLGAAGPALADLAARGTGSTALLAGLAGGAVSPAVAADADPVEAATALTAVLLPGDERRQESGAVLDLTSHDRAGAMLRAEPTT